MAGSFSRNSLLTTLLLLVLLGGCRRGGPAADAQPSDVTAAARSWADSVVSTLSLEDRVGQLLMPALYARTDSLTVATLERFLGENRVGGILLLQGDTLSARNLAARARSLSPLTPLIAIDAEWGLGMRLEGGSLFPANGRISPEATDQQIYDYGREIARESRRFGINMILGPVLDVAGENAPPLVALRSFGADSRRVADLSVAYAKGLESGGVMSVAKHFPGHGATRDDSHRVLPTVEREAVVLDSVDLYPFRQYIAADLSAIMVGHLWVPALDTVRRSAALSPVVMKDLLRSRMGFRGLVITDALNMKGAQEGSALDAVAAGADIVLAPADLSGAFGQIMQGVRQGRLSEADLNRKVSRILFYKFLFTPPATTRTPSGRP